MRFPWIVLFLMGCAGLKSGAQTKDFLHIPSGMAFPAHQEQFKLGPVDDGAATSNNLSLYYLFPDGHRVLVKVYPAPADAHGPTTLHGDSKSDATPAFLKEFEHIIF